MLMVIGVILCGLAQLVFVIGALWMLWKIMKFVVKFVFGGLKAACTTKGMKRRAKARQKRKFDRKVRLEVKKETRKVRREERSKVIKVSLFKKIMNVIKEELK